MKNILLLFLISFLALYAAAQSAGFSKNSTDTFFCESAQLRFTNTSDLAGNELSAYSFKWHFGKPQKLSVSRDSVITRSTDVNMRFDRPGWHYIRLVMLREQDTMGVYVDSIQIRPRPNAWFSVADTFQLGDLTYRFLSGKAPDSKIKYTYRWIFGSDTTLQTNSGSNIRNLYIRKFNNETPETNDNFLPIETMKLLVSDDKECTDSYSATFRIKRKLVFPTGFTPNNDGYNDFFKVQVNGRDEFLFQVFDPKGVLIFKSQSNNVIWDGYDMSGNKMPGGIYYFLVESVKADIPVKETGYVMLMRSK